MSQCTVRIQLKVSFSTGAVSMGERAGGENDHKRKENSEEFPGCAKESQACLFFGWVGQGDWGQKKKNTTSNWSTKEQTEHTVPTHTHTMVIKVNDDLL